MEQLDYNLLFAGSWADTDDPIWMRRVQQERERPAEGNIHLQFFHKVVEQRGLRDCSRTSTQVGWQRSSRPGREITRASSRRHG